MATQKGVWNLQQVRDKQLQSLWEYYDLYAQGNGELWAWGLNNYGMLGQNNRTNYSSPVQIPGTTWSKVSSSGSHSQTIHGIKTDGTLWGWGSGFDGQVGVNNATYYSSPVQIPGTTWNSFAGISAYSTAATKTDNTLWVWGQSIYGELGTNQSGSNARLSSPTQLPGTWTLGDGGEGRYNRMVVRKV